MSFFYTKCGQSRKTVGQIRRPLSFCRRGTLGPNSEEISENVPGFPNSPEVADTPLTTCDVSEPLQ